MNYEKAIQILQIEVNDKQLTEKIIKHHYFKLARIYHPDKNNNEKTNNHTHFLEIKESYEYLLKYYGYLNDENYELEENDIGSMEQSYIWSKFVQPFFNSNLLLILKTKVFYTLINELYKKCEDRAFSLINGMDFHQLKKIYFLLEKNQTHFHITDHFLSKMQVLIAKKQEQTNHIILRPTLSDLLEENLYIYQVDNEKIFIPLWHQELTYQINDSELIVEIIPNLDSNIEIDENNNIILIQNYKIEDLWKKKEILITIGKKQLIIDKKQISMEPMQEIIFKNQGISKLNVNDIYNTKHKSNIIIILIIS